MKKKINDLAVMAELKREVAARDVQKAAAV